ncbi:fungal-specific transcription factor domain-containing protein [Xylogone sp. PMI_703]|nr:fungal-specific transcription factor domain-containing protein [Xylogone sp. PMI_703]
MEYSTKIQLHVASEFLNIPSTKGFENLPIKPQLRHDYRSITPDYLKPLSSELAPEDIEFLVTKGALWIPPSKLRDAILCSYIKFVHPFLPILELPKLLCIFQGQKATENTKMSILLFQAIMFAASVYVDVNLLIDNGFNTRRAARKEMYQRVKFLAEFKVDTDEISYIQSLLLMTYWYETPDNPKGMCYWLGIAITVANGIDLHRDPEILGYDKETCKLRKRIWWSCIMRDSVTALGMRQPAKIRDDDYDVPMLTLDDFDVDSLSNRLVNNELGSQLDHAALLQQQQASLCLQNAKLCLILREVLSVQYTVDKINQSYDRNGLYTKPTMSLLPRISNNAERVKSCEQNLRRRADELPDRIRCRGYSPSRSNHPDLLLQLHLSVLHMLYHTTIITFYRPWRVSYNMSPTRNSQKSLARKFIQNSATAISEIARDLYHIRGICFLPLTALSALGAASISHIEDASRGPVTTQGIGVWHFNNCYRCIQILRDLYPLADYAACVVQSAAGSSCVYAGVTGYEPSRKSGKQAYDLEKTEALTIREGSNLAEAIQFTGLNGLEDVEIQAQNNESQDGYGVTVGYHCRLTTDA